MILMTSRSTLCCTTGFNPTQLLMGRNIRTMLPTLEKNPLPKWSSRTGEEKKRLSSHFSLPAVTEPGICRSCNQRYAVLSVLDYGRSRPFWPSSSINLKWGHHPWDHLSSGIIVTSNQGQPPAHPSTDQWEYGLSTHIYGGSVSALAHVCPSVVTPTTHHQVFLSGQVSLQAWPGDRSHMAFGEDDMFFEFTFNSHCLLNCFYYAFEKNTKVQPPLFTIVVESRRSCHVFSGTAVWAEKQQDEGWSCIGEMNQEGGWKQVMTATSQGQARKMRRTGGRKWQEIWWKMQNNIIIISI